MGEFPLLPLVRRRVHAYSLTRLAGCFEPASSGGFGHMTQGGHQTLAYFLLLALVAYVALNGGV